MSNEWDGKVVMSTPGGPIVTMSLGHVLARKDAEIERLRAEVERLRAALKIAAGYVNGCYHAWHLTRDRAEAWRDLTKIREALNDERAGELEAKP